MIKNINLALFVVVTSVRAILAQSSLNTELIDNIDYDVFVNDVWGYTDAQNNDYAIVGLRDGVAFVAVYAEKTVR